MEKAKEVQIVAEHSPNPQVSKIDVRGRLQILLNLTLKGHPKVKSRAIFKLTQRNWKVTNFTLELWKCKESSLGDHVQNLIQTEQVFPSPCPLHSIVIPKILVLRQHLFQTGNACTFEKYARTATDSCSLGHKQINFKDKYWVNSKHVSWELRGTQKTKMKKLYFYDKFVTLPGKKVAKIHSKNVKWKETSLHSRVLFEKPKGRENKGGIIKFS